MKVDCLVAEIGSTTTIVSAFNIDSGLVYIGKGMHQTTVNTDVNEGLLGAIEDLKRNLNIDQLTYGNLYASSSAAGGLRITVHGLVYEMTAKAAKEAALNAGGNIHCITANRLEAHDIEKIEMIKPNMIIIAGGTNYGEKEVSYQNLLDVAHLNIPIIYTGNIVNHDRIQKLNLNHIEIVDNVYPRVDDFNIMPLREKIYELFEKNIIYAKGMAHVFDTVTGKIIPTPGSVMDVTYLLNELFDGVMTIDVGGATTDIHSISEPKKEFEAYLEGMPKAKRTVEGDLGIYVNRRQVYTHFKKNELEQLLELDEQSLLKLMDEEPFIPQSTKGKALSKALLKKCVEEALDRHIGDLKRVFTTNGIKVIPEGKDCTNVKAIFLTGGALIHHEESSDFVRKYLEKQTTKLTPNSKVKIYKDKAYLFSALGVLSFYHKDKVKAFLKTILEAV